MIKHIWSVLCRESIVNKDDNTINLISVLEKLSVIATPLKGVKPDEKPINIPFNYEFVNLWSQEDKAGEEKGELEVTVLDPEGKNIIKTHLREIKFPPGASRLRTRLKITGFGAKKSGIHIFRVRLKESNEKKFRLIAEIPLEVEIKIEKPK